MQIYLPIAELSVNIWLILGLGGGVGFLSGLFGVGGGFLLTPLLIFLGVPPAVAVATSANQVVAASVSGVIAHWRLGNVDFRMGSVLLAGGLAGSFLGAWVFAALKRVGQLELAISIAYVLLLGTIGGMMLTEVIRTMRRQHAASQTGVIKRRRLHEHNMLHGLPLKMRFRRSQLYISALLPLGLGFVIGILAAIMGVGAGFLAVPAMIYLLGMPTSVVIGTSLFQIIFVTANVTVLHAINTKSLDIVLALLLLFGSVVGAQYGARAATVMKAEQLRGLLALVVLGVAVMLGFDLVATPIDIFSLEPGALR